MAFKSDPLKFHGQCSTFLQSLPQHDFAYTFLQVRLLQSVMDPFFQIPKQEPVDGSLPPLTMLMSGFKVEALFLETQRFKVPITVNWEVNSASVPLLKVFFWISLWVQNCRFSVPVTASLPFDKRAWHKKGYTPRIAILISSLFHLASGKLHFSVFNANMSAATRMTLGAPSLFWNHSRIVEWMHWQKLWPLLLPSVAPFTLLWA